MSENACTFTPVTLNIRIEWVRLQFHCNCPQNKDLLNLMNLEYSTTQTKRHGIVEKWFAKTQLYNDVTEICQQNIDGASKIKKYVSVTNTSYEGLILDCTST